MELGLSSEESRLVDLSTRLAQDFAQRSREYDESASFPTENFKELHQAGLLGLTIPKQYGGSGYWQDRNYLAYYLVLQALGGGDASTAWLLKIHSHAAGTVARHGNDDQRERVLTDIVQNGALLASLGSEASPAQSSQVGEYPTGKAELEKSDSGYELSCTKHFATVGPAAKYLVVHTRLPGTAAVADRYQLLVLPADRAGITLENNWDVMGGRATVSWAVHFDRVAVTDEDLLGGPGDWVYDDPRTFTLGHAAIILGIAEGILSFLRDHLAARPALAANEAVAYTFGEMDSQLQSCRTSMWYAAWLWEQQKYDDAEAATLRAIHVIKESAMMVATRAFEIYGARGAFRSLPFDRAFRDIRTLSLHHRETSLIRMLVDHDLGLPYHSKQNYGAPH